MSSSSEASGRTVEVQRNDIPVTTHVEAWDWRCSACGHVSRGHVSERAARKDFDRHVCRPF